MAVAAVRSDEGKARKRGKSHQYVTYRVRVLDDSDPETGVVHQVRVKEWSPVSSLKEALAEALRCPISQQVSLKTALELIMVHDGWVSAGNGSVEMV